MIIKILYMQFLNLCIKIKMNNEILILNSIQLLIWYHSMSKGKKSLFYKCEIEYFEFKMIDCNYKKIFFIYQYINKRIIKNT